MEPDLPEAFWRLHDGLPQQGPGSDESTRRALALVPDLPSAPRILDLGCGPGRQTLALARETGGTVTAVDVLPRFLDELRARAADAGLAERIRTVRQSMAELDLDGGPFDLLWCEGAIYCMGFPEGLRAWRRWLRPAGALAVSELAWLTRTPPERARRFLAEAYPAMQHHDDNLRLVAECGYESLGSFVLPESDWWIGYYDEIARRIERLRAERLEPEARQVLDAEQEEIDVFRSHEGSYGYVFYVMRLAGAG